MGGSRKLKKCCRHNFRSADFKNSEMILDNVNWLNFVEKNSRFQYSASICTNSKWHLRIYVINISIILHIKYVWDIRITKIGTQFFGEGPSSTRKLNNYINKSKINSLITQMAHTRKTVNEYSWDTWQYDIGSGR